MKPNFREMFDSYLPEEILSEFSAVRDAVLSVDLNPLTV